jgi:shikimate 5-dehydrogenase
MGAVNTVVRTGDKLFGENTDGKGFMQALTQDAKVNPKGKKVLVLGAGGAARSITVELALAGAQQITVMNRSAERGRVLTKLLGSKSPARASFSAWQGTYSTRSIRISWSTPHPSGWPRAPMKDRILITARSVRACWSVMSSRRH